MDTREAGGQSQTVVVLGGSGFFGRYLVEDLIAHTDARVVAASRHPGRSHHHSARVEARWCDVNDPSSVNRLLEGADIVIHCAGPFQDLPLTPLHAAIEAGVHYIDIAEDREFARRVVSLDGEARAAGIAVLTGCSVVPGMQALFARMLAPRFDELQSIRTFAAPDTRRHRGHAMFHTMLRGAGRPIPVLRDGHMEQRYGWSEPEWVDFPPPVGPRLTFLVLEMADIDILPSIFDVRTVEFKAGSEFPRSIGYSASVPGSGREPDVPSSSATHPRFERFRGWQDALAKMRVVPCSRVGAALPGLIEQSA